MGAGGTACAAAYAATRLGLDLIFFNRTPEKALQLVEIFGGTSMNSLDNLIQVEDLAVVISTLPASVGFVPDSKLLRTKKPVVFDVNYKPYSTLL